MNTNTSAIREDIAAEEAIETVETTETTLHIQTGVKAGGWLDDLLGAATFGTPAGLYL